MTNPTDPFEEFEELWDASLARAEGTPDWNDMTLEEQKDASMKFRKALKEYGRSKQTGNRMASGACASLRSSSKAGDGPGR